MANVLPMKTRVDIVSMLIEGNSLRAVERKTGVAKSTILRLVVALGVGCARVHNRIVRGLASSLIEADEQWSFCHTKQKRVKDTDPVEYGDIWTFSAFCRITRLIICYVVGKRDQATANAFMADLRSRITVVPQISTDALALYQAAVGASFDGGRSVDYGTIKKTFSGGVTMSPDHKYEPPRDPFITKATVFGAPDEDLMSTSLLERYHLTARHINGRKRRLCLAFSKKGENHLAAVCISVMAYNFLRIHGSLRVTPAMEAGLTDHVWSVEELITVALAEVPLAPPVVQPLTMPTHRAGRPVAPSRALPGGGFLRLVSGDAPESRSAPELPAPPPPPAPVPPPAVASQGSQGAPVEPTGQLDLLAWRRPLPPPGAQLTLFGEPEPPK
jgi:IS1 family transposase